jgi:amino acid permease
MFKILGVLLFFYVAISFATGNIYAKDRAWGRTYRRDENPWNYWSTLVIYSLLSIAMFFLFGRR